MNRITNYLLGTQYGFAIPADATIDGITVVINRVSGGTAPDVLDNIVSLVKDGVIIGDNKASAVSWPPSQFATATYGGDADLWGTTWTPADINATAFGVVLSAQKQPTGDDRWAWVDYMQVTVTYSYPATTTAVDCGGGTPVVAYGDSITCQATVARAAGPNTPTGTVSWTTDGGGSFDTSACTLAGADGTATCSVSYTPSAVGDGSHLISAAYGGDANFDGSGDDQAVTVNRRPITVTADAKTKVYGEDDPVLTYQYTGTCSLAITSPVGSLASLVRM